MTIWLDEQISPFLAPWLSENFGVECSSVTRLPVDRGSDIDIFMAARQANAVVMSKDSDFADLVTRLGPPPQVLWLRTGNRSNQEMKEFLLRLFPTAINMLSVGEVLVEIS